MESWKGKFAVVTGASAGIGAEIVKDLAKNGINVIGLARRPEMIDEYGKAVVGENYGKIYSYKCDVSSLESIKAAFKWIEEKFSVIHIIVNNAGVLKNINILGEKDYSKEIEQTINTNFTGLVHCTHEAYQLIKNSNDYGLIINVNSNAGHKIFFPGNGVSHNVYHSSKFAVTAACEVMRQELIMQENDKVRVTVSLQKILFFFFQKSQKIIKNFPQNSRHQSISPGVVTTDIFQSGGYQQGSHYTALPSIQPADVSNAIMFLLTTPHYVNITELTIKHVSQRF
jgi:NADP+-dependent farnesol dehydrogenase